MSSTVKESISLSWANVKSNKLRTGITVVIMALGIFALILIITAIRAASNSLTDSFSTMGSNTFGISYKSRFMRFGNNRGGAAQQKKKGRQKKSNIGIPISFNEASEFKSRYAFPGTVTSIALMGASEIVASYGNKKTNPDVNIFGGDENYVDLNGYSITAGRNFTVTESGSGSSICILGSAVAEKLFPENPAKAIDKVIQVDHRPYKVIAVLKDKGSSAFFNTGRVVLLPLANVRRYYSTSQTSYNLAVKVSDLKMIDIATGEATAFFRPIRKLQVTDEDNFNIDKSDSIAETVINNLSWLEKGTIGIAFITLIGAAIGLMNIMLVAVNERTKEIGLLKALGGTKQDIRKQFLFESIIISLIGAAAGIVAGIIVGNIVAILLKTGFVLPWGWVLISIVVCSFTGLAAGLYPAYKASNLDPIVALRYE